MLVSAHDRDACYFGGWQVPWLPTDKLVLHAHGCAEGDARPWAALVRAVFACWMFCVREACEGQVSETPGEQKAYVLGTISVLAAAALLFFLW